ncbi:uncharacterized protein LOC123009681 [Tribolium madens]|uniref:uncharacterized protein LOC123009681 n=1 Tax=Tribolium madens TaxID=41895 RepID=UPI001CF764DA|nr:uncharacterized protein LOC123009681 [Tribolium madens]
MDYFYGAPRRPPAPPTINRIDRVPIVPEVSIIENSFLSLNPPVRHQNTDKSQLRESFSCNNSKKHVRFQSPFFPTCDKENQLPQPQTLKAVPDLNGKTFKQIYMANVPDRHLDLSLFEPSVCEKQPQEPQLPQPEASFTNYAEFRQRQSQMCNKNNEIARLKSIENVDLRHFECPKPAPRQVEICTQTEPRCTEITPTSDEPTIRDLYKIIQQQNEQIMLLQRQVNNLKTSIRQPEIDSGPHEDLNNSPKKSIFSFDVKATSFEFSFRPQHNKFRKQNDFLEPRIQEIVENSAENANSLRLEESLNVGNSYVSDVPSIQIKMDDYRSSDDEEESQGNNVGLTFYKDLMDQVHNVLKKVQKQSECQNRRHDLAGQTMKAVKQATLQHLKDIGVNLSPIQESSEVTRESDLDENCDQTDVSCAVQQLLMKYLPEDKLAKAINKPLPTKEKHFKPPLNTDFSFATLQYMKKYNLIDGNTKKGQKVGKNLSETTNPKILDVTALKLQPKLL